MPSFEEHCKHTHKELGNRFEEVHRYLDSYVRQFGYAHRFLLHHKEGIEEVRKYYGDEAAEAARLHIILDCEGYIPKKSDYSTGKVDGCGILRVHEENKEENL